LLPGFYDAGFAQQAQLLRDVDLGTFQDCLEMADAGRRTAQFVEDVEPAGMGKQLKSCSDQDVVV